MLIFNKNNNQKKNNLKISERFAALSSASLNEDDIMRNKNGLDQLALIDSFNERKQKQAIIISK